MKRYASVTVAILVLLGMLAVPAWSADDPEVGDVSVVRTYDAEANELPEGVTVDSNGLVYVSMTFTGEIRRVDPTDGSEEVFATLPTGGGFGPTGLAVDEDDNIFAGVITGDPATQGVYRITPDGETSRLPGSEAIGFANGLAFGEDGELYVTDSGRGAVWRIPEDGTAEVWFEDPLIQGDGSFPPPFPIGANGIAYNDEEVYVTNTELGSIVEIEIDGDTGAAEDPEVIIQDPALSGADGLAVDEDGELYVAVISQSTILRVDEDDHEIEEVLADGSDGLDWASSVAFGRGDDDETILYAVNFSTGPFFGGTRTHGPALLAIEAGVEGLPLP